MMMLAVMYGMIPSAKIENEPNAPPENRSRKPSAPCDFTPSWNCLMASLSMPGTRIATPRRYSATMARVNKILLRRSATLKMFFKFENTRDSSAGLGWHSTTLGRTCAGV